MATKIPHAPRLPIIGNLHQIAGKKILQRLIDFTAKFEPLTEIKVLGIKILIITRVDLAKEVLDDTYFDKFIDHPIEHLRAVAGDGLFTAWTHEPNWKKAHNVLTPAFNHKAIEGYTQIMVETIDQLLDDWAKLPAETPIDLAADMTKLAFEIIGLCGFDFSFETFTKKETHPFVEAMLFAFDESVYRARTPAFVTPLRIGSHFKFKKYVNYMNKLIDDIIQKRYENPAEHQDKIDFLSLMMNTVDKETGEKLSDENIRYQIVTFLVAGHETTAALLAFAFYSLLSHPEYLKQAYEEVDTITGGDPQYKISSEDFMKFGFLRKVLMETLRLYPPLVLFTRYSPKDTTIGKEAYPVKANQSISIMLYHMHRDKAHWGENPDKFDPSHFEAAAIAKRDKDAYKPFGHGARACIGQHFAMLEATLTLAKVLQSFELSLPPDYKMVFAESPALRPDNLMITVQARKKA